MKAIVSFLLSSVSMGIWLFLLYKVLIAVNATELMWFLYYSYIPAVLGSTTLAILVMKDRS